MGINLALSILPTLLLPVFGTLVDRLLVRVPLLLGNLLRAALQLGVGWLALRGPVPLEALHAAALVGGLLGAFYSPASLSVTPRLVPKEQWQQAGGLMQGSTQLMQTAGMALGGIIVARFGSAAALLADGAAFLLFSFLLLGVRFPAQAAAQKESFQTAFLAGLDYLRRRPFMAAMPVMAFVVNTCFIPLEMLVPKRMVALGAGAGGFGLFFALNVAGMALGSFANAALKEKAAPEKASLQGLVGMSVLLCLLALTTTPLQMQLVSLGIGLCNGYLQVGLRVLFQRHVETAFLGRVGSLLNMAGLAGQPIVLMLLSPFADRVPASVFFLLFGVFSFLGAAHWRYALGLASKPTTAPA